MISPVKRLIFRIASLTYAGGMAVFIYLMAAQFLGWPLFGLNAAFITILVVATLFYLMWAITLLVLGLIAVSGIRCFVGKVCEIIS